jgi:hypothetical protein
MRQFHESNAWIIEEKFPGDNEMKLLSLAVIFSVMVVLLTSCLAQPIPEIKTSEGQIIPVSQISEDRPSAELNRLAEQSAGVAPESEIMLNFPAAKQLTMSVYAKNSEGAWEGTEPERVHTTLKAPKEKGIFIIELEATLDSKDMVQHDFAIEVR